MNQDWVNDWYLLGATADIAPGAVGRRIAGTHNLAVFNIDGKFFAAADACIVCRTAISEGAIISDAVECKGCGSTFRIIPHELGDGKTGSQLSTYPVMVVDDEIFAWIARISHQAAPS
jgi:nitrite reductase/ring-hydroxylating ferredoxin subunit